MAVTHTISGTITSGADYTAPSGILTLDTAASSGTITIRTLEADVRAGRLVADPAVEARPQNVRRAPPASARPETYVMRSTTPVERTASATWSNVIPCS